MISARHLLVFASLLGASSLRGAAAADPAAEANKKLRENLRNTLIQLRTVETEKATLQAAQTELEQKNKDLEDKIKGLERKVADLVKQGAADKAAAEKKESELNSSIATRDLEISRQAESLKKWKEFQAKAEETLKALSADRASKASQVVLLQRRVDDQQRKNAEMYKVGSEILDRYAKFGLGTALSAREPFVGITRAKLETLVQDYADRLADAKIKAGEKPAPAAAASKQASSSTPKAEPKPAPPPLEPLPQSKKS